MHGYNIFQIQDEGEGPWTYRDITLFLPGNDPLHCECEAEVVVVGRPGRSGEALNMRSCVLSIGP